MCLVLRLVCCQTKALEPVFNIEYLEIKLAVLYFNLSNVQTNTKTIPFTFRFSSPNIYGLGAWTPGGQSGRGSGGLWPAGLGSDASEASASSPLRRHAPHATVSDQEWTPSDLSDPHGLVSDVNRVKVRRIMSRVSLHFTEGRQL